MACAGGKLFVGQVFSDFVLAIDIETQSIVKRVPIPGGGEGAIAASPDGRRVYFASNKVPRAFIIDTATNEFETIDYPEHARGCLCVLPHPSEPLLYLGIQRGGRLGGISYFGGNCFLGFYDHLRHRYAANLYLAEVIDDRSDDATPTLSASGRNPNACSILLMRQLSPLSRCAGPFRAPANTPSLGP